MSNHLIRILFINTSNLRNWIHELHDRAGMASLNDIEINVTWGHAKVTDAETCVTGYWIFRIDRDNEIAGGGSSVMM